MLGMSHNTFLLLDAVVTIIGLIVLITRFKLHPFIALIIASAFLGLTAGMPANLIIKSFQDGFGGVLGFVGIILALGTARVNLLPGEEDLLGQGVSYCATCDGMFYRGKDMIVIAGGF